MSSDSSVNYHNPHEVSIGSTYDELSDSDPTTYFQNMNLRYFVSEPRRMLTEHAALKELCLQNGNLEAHYIEGVLQFFVHKNKHSGFYHLRQAVGANYSNAIYLYGLLLLAREHYLKGKQYLDKLKWKQHISTSDHCLERIKNSLRDITVPMKMKYYVSMVNLAPKDKCDHDETMNEVCKHCYYHKRVKQFVRIATDIL